MMVKREHDIQIQNQDNTKIRNSGGIQVYKKKADIRSNVGMDV